MKFTKLLVAAGIALSALGAQAQTNLVTNGSFESLAGLNATTFNSQGWDIFSGLEGWTGEKNIELRRSGVDGVASEGGKFVELDTAGAPNSNQSMSQLITATGWVTLTFDYMARVNSAFKGATNGLDFSFGGPTMSVLSNAVGGTNATAWQTYSGLFYFGETESSKTLRFTATATPDTYGASLDNVSVTAVPEVETYAMMLAGLGLMGTIARRRKNKAA